MAGTEKCSDVDKSPPGEDLRFFLRGGAPERDRELLCNGEGDQSTGGYPIQDGGNEASICHESEYFLAAPANTGFILLRSEGFTRFPMINETTSVEKFQRTLKYNPEGRRGSRALQDLTLA